MNIVVKEKTESKHLSLRLSCIPWKNKPNHPDLYYPFSLLSLRKVVYGIHSQNKYSSIMESLFLIIR